MKKNVDCEVYKQPNVMKFTPQDTGKLPRPYHNDLLEVQHLHFTWWINILLLPALAGPHYNGQEAPAETGYRMRIQGAFEEMKGEPKRYWTEVLLLTSLSPYR